MENDSIDNGQSLMSRLFFGSRFNYNRKDFFSEVRGVEISKKDFDEYARPIIYGEVSNRQSEKKELESRVILNTAINRMTENQNRKKKTSLKDILTQKGQYQAYEGEQYNLYKGQDKNVLDEEKKVEINQILDNIYGEMSKGQFKDNTNNAFFYQHNEDGSITYDDTKPFYK